MAAKSNNSTISFHRNTYGQNIQFKNNYSTANRTASFDNGIVFSDRPIKENEKVSFEITDAAPDGHWLGSFSIGFTEIDPSSIARNQLSATAMPNLCQKSGNSYMKRINSGLTKYTVVSFYFNKDGAFYILDGNEHVLCEYLKPKSPLWAVIDIYGNVKEICIIASKILNEDCKSFIARYQKKPDQLPIKYHQNLTSDMLNTVNFFDRYGPELELFCENKVAFRKNVPHLSRPYLFVQSPLAPNDELYFRILSVDPSYRSAGFIGFTNAGPDVFMQNFRNLPSNDPSELLDRTEFWIIQSDCFGDQINELDEYRINFKQSGELTLTQNNRTTRTIAYGDASLHFHPFFFLNGRISAIALFGATSATPPKPVVPIIVPDPEPDEANLCKVCYVNLLDCVILPCGHMFFCLRCKEKYEQKGKIICPMCQNPYTTAIRINN